MGSGFSDITIKWLNIVFTLMLTFLTIFGSVMMYEFTCLKEAQVKIQDDFSAYKTYVSEKFVPREQFRLVTNNHEKIADEIKVYVGEIRKELHTLNMRCAQNRQDINR